MRFTIALRALDALKAGRTRPLNWKEKKHLKKKALEPPINYIVQRKHLAPLTGAIRAPSLRARHFVYETLEDPHKEPKIIPVYLTQYVPDLGRPGEVVNIEDNIARKLILIKSGVYASLENLSMVKIKLAEDAYSTKYVGTTVGLLSNYVLKIPMSTDESWTLEPWHVRTAFRLSGIHISENSFAMPDDLVSHIENQIENHQFNVKVTINNKEVVEVRCEITKPINEDE